MQTTGEDRTQETAAVKRASHHVDYFITDPPSFLPPPCLSNRWIRTLWQTTTKRPVYRCQRFQFRRAGTQTGARYTRAPRVRVHTFCHLSDSETRRMAKLGSKVAEEAPGTARCLGFRFLRAIIRCELAFFYCTIVYNCVTSVSLPRTIYDQYCTTDWAKTTI